MINPTLWVIVQNKQSLDTALDALLARLFPPQKQFSFYQELTLIRQANYQLIAEYVAALDNALYKWTTAAGVPPKENARYRSTHFETGLCPETLIEMRKLGLYSIEEMESKITEVEHSICKAISSQNRTPAENTMATEPQKSQTITRNSVPYFDVPITLTKRVAERRERDSQA